MGRLRGAAANIVSLPDPFKDPGVDPISHVRDVPSSGKMQPDVVTDIVAVDPAKNTGEVRHYADPYTGSVPTVAPVLRRELRRHRNDLVYGEISRVNRDYETVRTNEFYWRGAPPAAVAFHYGKNPRALKYDGTHAIDHDRVAVADHLRGEAWNACEKYTKKIADEVAAQEFENMLCHTMDLAHDKTSTQFSKIRTEEDRAHAKEMMTEAKEMRKQYHEKLLRDQYETHKLVFCRDPQILKGYGGRPVNPVHWSWYHSDGDRSITN